MKENKKNMEAVAEEAAVNMTTAELEELATAAAIDYVAALNKGETRSELKKLKTALKSAQDAYNASVCKDAYLEWSAKGDPVTKAIAERTISGKTWAIKYDKADVAYMAPQASELDISFRDMEDLLGSEIFSDPDWFTKSAALAWVVASSIAESVHDTKFAYMVDEAAKAFEFADGKLDTKDDEQCIRALQEVFDAIKLVEDVPGSGNKYVATDAAWHYLQNGINRGGKHGELGIGGTGAFSALVHDAMNIAAIVDARYSVKESNR